MSIHNGMLCARGRLVAGAAITALVLTAVVPPQAVAAPLAPPQKDAAAIAAAPDAAGVIQVRHRRHYRGGNAAGLAMMGLMFGTIGNIVAQERRREFYERYYAPRYYGYSPYYYGAPYYGSPYYDPY